VVLDSAKHIDHNKEWDMTFASCRRSKFILAGLVGAAAILVTAFHPDHASAADTVQARKDIKAMGLDYKAEDFAKAAGNGDLVAVQLFIDAGMDVNAGGGAAIGLAAGRGNLKIVQFLLSHGAKPTSNALQYARTRGHKEVEKVLVEAGAREQ
jgi:uncharacterized protein